MLCFWEVIIPPCPLSAVINFHESTASHFLASPMMTSPDDRLDSANFLWPSDKLGDFEHRDNGRKHLHHLDRLTCHAGLSPGRCSRQRRTGTTLRISLGYLWKQLGGQLDQYSKHNITLWDPVGLSCWSHLNCTKRISKARSSRFDNSLWNF